MKICGFVKFYNEGENGNLERCLKNISKFCDAIVCCNDSSTDNSLEIAKKYTDHIITLPDEFTKELQHKQKLLELALTLNPDWIYFQDPDECLEQRGTEGIKRLCSFGDQFGFDCFNFHTTNLWASKCWYRTDSLFNQKWDIKLWKNTGNLKFPDQTGLHNPQHPDGLTRSHETNLQIIHFGFSDIDQIARKYATYKKLGQSGWALERLRPDDINIKLEPVDLRLFSEEEKPKIEPPPKISKEEFEKACQKYL